MLNEDSIPVWMLADSLLALLVTGALSCVAVLPLALHGSSTSEHKEPGSESVESSPDVLRATQSALSEARTQLQTADAVWQSLRAEKESLQQAAVNSQQTAQALQVRLTELQHMSATEKSVRQELLGLKGSMDQTVFVIDISASMANEFSADFTRANWKSGENAWSNVQRKIRDYLEMLPVGKFRMVCFNHALHEFPTVADTWSTDRQAAMDFLASLTPEGTTNTEQALLKAAAYKPSSILLFTDGQPTRIAMVKSASGLDEQTSVFDFDQQLRILAMPVTGTIECPVNVIALNDYASHVAMGNTTPSARTLLAFLQELAGRSGGAFLGY